MPHGRATLGADQLQNADRARRLGIATYVDPATVTVEALQAAIEQTLESAPHRASCRALGEEMAAMSGVERLPAELEAALG